MCLLKNHRIASPGGFEFRAAWNFIDRFLFSFFKMNILAREKLLVFIFCFHFLNTALWRFWIKNFKFFSFSSEINIHGNVNFLFFLFAIPIYLLNDILDQWLTSKYDCQKDRYCLQEISTWNFFSTTKIRIRQLWVNGNRRKYWWSRYLCSFLLFNLFVLFLCYHQVSQAIQFLKVINLPSANKQINCSKSTKETLEKYVKFVQSWQ